MDVPKGFDELVALAMRERPAAAKSTEELWEKFLYPIFMGGKRSEPQVRFLVAMLKAKGLLDMPFVLKTGGEDWRESVQALIAERSAKIRDEEMREMLREFGKELFRISASIKGSARFFEKNITPEKMKELDTREKTWSFIESLAADPDVPNIRYTKIIIWLHEVGCGYDFCPPSWHVKAFLNNEIGPYYQFYDDEKYFMARAEELSREIAAKVKGATARDVSVAIFYFMSMKRMFPPRSADKKKFTPLVLAGFLKKKKWTLKQLSERLNDDDGRETLGDELVTFMNNRRLR